MTNAIEPRACVHLPWYEPGLCVLGLGILFAWRLANGSNNAILPARYPDDAGAVDWW